MAASTLWLSCACGAFAFGYIGGHLARVPVGGVAGGFGDWGAAFPMNLL